jgi:DNA-binding MarR family transcriptional regulator
MEGSEREKMDRWLTTLPCRQSADYMPLDDRLPERPLLALLLRLLNHAYAQEVHAALAGAGFGDIRTRHANVFPFVPPDGIQVAELAKLAQVRKQTMAQAVEQLEQLGYVERRPDPDDRRARLVVLTERGRAVKPVTAAAGARVEKRWATLTSPEDVETLRATLRRLLVAIHADDDHDLR